MSETATCRDHFRPWCRGNGADLGFGGDPLVPWAICIDRPEGDPLRCVDPNPHPTHFVGDVRDLPFKDAVLDWVFSSHVLEDFPEAETVPVLREWLRVLKPGGYLLLFLPDQPTYAAHCARAGVEPNQAHRIPHFGPEYVRRCLTEAGGNDIVEIKFPFPTNSYSFSAIAKKL